MTQPTSPKVLYVEMTRITRKDITFSVSSILPSGAAGTLTGVDLAVLPKRQDPNSNTTWTPAAFSAGDATFWIVGPDGDPTGALVINYDDYVWAWPKGIPEIEPVKIVRARVRGPNPAAPPNAGSVSYATTAALTAALTGKQALQQVAATITASGALVLNKHNPVDATGGAKTMTLPIGQAEGAQVSVEKTDSSVNAVSVTGSIRGVGSSTISLPWQNEALLLRADSSGSWWPISGHKTKASLDAVYGHSDPVLASFVYDGTGNLTSYTEDGIAIVLTYNVDGTVATSKRGTNATRTFSYSGGNLTGVA